MKKEKKENIITERSPIITVMGHVDHGKSTLLDYIRKTNTVDREAGGITQKTSAYEVIHKTPAGVEKKITFIDTPGHAAFSKMRSRGAEVADIVILVVAADDGVNVQTLEALKTIQDSKTPYLVAINKIDKPNANVEKTKLDLASNGVFLEGYGGDTPNVPISAKTGVGIPELLDLLLLMADMNELVKSDSKNAEGFVMESNLDSKRGGIATLIIKNGMLNKGDFLIIDGDITPVRSIENYMGGRIDSASASSPIKIIGFSALPSIGSKFFSAGNKKDAEKIAEKQKEELEEENKNTKENFGNAKVILPVIIKADFQGTVEAIIKELKKLENDDVKIRVIDEGVGNITENDVKRARGDDHPLIIGFNVVLDKDVAEIGQNLQNPPMLFDIIYKINEAIEIEIKKRTPRVEIEKTTGQARILKCFSRQKDKQVVGGTVLTGSIFTRKNVKIFRQKNEIGSGEIMELQEKKQKAKDVTEGNQFGAMIESKITISEGDIIESFEMVTE